MLWKEIQRSKKEKNSHIFASQSQLLFFLGVASGCWVAILKVRLDDQSHLTSKLKWLSLGLFKRGLFAWRDESLAHSRGCCCCCWCPASIATLSFRYDNGGMVLAPPTLASILLTSKMYVLSSCHTLKVHQFVFFFSFLLVYLCIYLIKLKHYLQNLLRQITISEFFSWAY